MKVGFICVHNSCRSQMAQALAKLLADDVIDAYSAGEVEVEKINQDAVRTIKNLYDYDMSNQTSKTLDKIPKLDIVITMGCNVKCPTIECIHREDWGLDDPSGKSDEEFINTAKTIEQKVLELKKRILDGEFSQ